MQMYLQVGLKSLSGIYAASNSSTVFGVELNIARMKLSEILESLPLSIFVLLRILDSFLSNCQQLFTGPNSRGSKGM